MYVVRTFSRYHNVQWYISSMDIIEEFIREARKFIRFGEGSGPSKTVLEQMRRRLADHPRPSDDARLCRRLCAQHYLADVYDKRGEYDLARDVLVDWAFVETLLSEWDSADRGDLGSDNDKELKQEALWVARGKSVALHRDGETKSAEELTSKIIRILDKMKPAAEWHELKARTHYAHARHLQANGRITEAEPSFSNALVCIRDLAQYSRDESDRRYALNLGAVLKIQISRSLIYQGQLSRAWRLLHFAELDLLLVAPKDELNIAFIKFLQGSVLRQESNKSLAADTIEKSIEKLDEAVKTFTAMQHDRYLARARHELAKAYLNRGQESDLNKALEYATPEKADAFRRDDVTLERWNVQSELLKGRIEYARKNFDKAMRHLEEARRILAGDKRLVESSADLQILASAVLVDVLIELGEESKAVEIAAVAEKVLERREQDVDVNDIAWLCAAKGEAHFRLKQAAKAQLCLEQWEKYAQRVENEHIKVRGAKFVALMNKTSDFFISAEEKENLGFEHHLNKLKEFLVNRVESAFPKETIEDKAKRLKIKRQTYKKWLTPPQAGDRSLSSTRLPRKRRVKKIKQK